MPKAVSANSSSFCVGDLRNLVVKTAMLYQSWGLVDSLAQKVACSSVLTGYEYDYWNLGLLWCVKALHHLILSRELSTLRIYAAGLIILLLTKSNSSHGCRFIDSGIIGSTPHRHHLDTADYIFGWFSPDIALQNLNPQGLHKHQVIDRWHSLLFSK